MKVSEFLRSARALIDKPEKWIQGTRRRYDTTSGIQQFCSVGALNAICEGDLRGTRSRARFFLDSLSGDIIAYNDNCTHAEVIAVWDKAIAMAEQNEGGEKVPVTDLFLPTEVAEKIEERELALV